MEHVYFLFVSCINVSSAIYKQLNHLWIAMKGGKVKSCKPVAVPCLNRGGSVACH